MEKLKGLPNTELHALMEMCRTMLQDEKRTILSGNDKKVTNEYNVLARALATIKTEAYSRLSSLS